MRQIYNHQCSDSLILPNINRTRKRSGQKSTPAAVRRCYYGKLLGLGLDSSRTSLVGGAGLCFWWHSYMCHEHTREYRVVCLTLHRFSFSSGVRVAVAFTPAAKVKHALSPLRVQTTSCIYVPRLSSMWISFVNSS